MLLLLAQCASCDASSPGAGPSASALRTLHGPTIVSYRVPMRLELNGRGRGCLPNLTSSLQLCSACSLCCASKALAVVLGRASWHPECMFDAYRSCKSMQRKI